MQRPIQTLRPELRPKRIGDETHASWVEVTQETSR